MTKAGAPAVMLFLGCLLVYGNTIPNGYSIDDELVTHGRHATSRGIAGLSEIFSTSYVDFFGQVFDYRPLALATFAVENELVGDNPHVGHFVNAVSYGLTTVVLFLFLRAVFGPDATLLAFVVSVLFLVHPIHTEVVASLKSRDELLATLFGLLSALSFLRYQHTRRTPHAAAGFLAFVVALMAKLSAVPFVVLIPLSLIYRKPAQWRRAMAVGASLAACAAVYQQIVLTFVPSFVPVPTFAENPLVAEPGWNVTLGVSLRSLLFYLEKLVVPYPLNFYYGYNVIPLTGVLAFEPVVALVVYTALGAYTLRYLPRLDPAAFGVAWFLVTLVPYANLVAPRPGIVAERSAYLPSIGFVIAVAAWIFRFARAGSPLRTPPGGRARVTAAALSALVLLHAVLTVSRNRAWADAFTLYETDIGRLHDSAMAHQIYSRKLRDTFATVPASEERTRRLERAIVLSQRATEIYPGYAFAYEHIGAIYLHDLQEPQKAFPYLERASDLAPHYVPAHYDALLCSVQLGRFDRALVFAERLLGEDPDHADGLYYMAKLHFQAGKIDEAFEENARLARLAPDRDLPYVNYGYFYYGRGDATRAIENFQKALAIAPRNKPVSNDLVALLKEQGRSDEAQRYHDEAERLDGE